MKHEGFTRPFQARYNELFSRACFTGNFTRPLLNCLPGLPAWPVNAIAPSGIKLSRPFPQVCKSWIAKFGNPAFQKLDCQMWQSSFPRAGLPNLAIQLSKSSLAKHNSLKLQPLPYPIILILPYTPHLRIRVKGERVGGGMGQDGLFSRAHVLRVITSSRYNEFGVITYYVL